MNRQPFRTPSRWWEPKLTPWVIKIMRPWIRRDLKRQKIAEIEVRGSAHLEQQLAEPVGVLITPNHSFHYDSYVLIETSHRLRCPFHFLVAWQVFEMGTPFERWVLQRHGAYSINREGSDLRAFKTSVDILQTSKYPLVIYPEGDIYHHNDRVSPFRDGAAAMALSAAKRSDRPIVVVPCAVKAFYLTDPSADLERLMGRLEESLHWKPATHRTMSERIYRFAEGLLALKELEYLGDTQAGSITERVRGLSEEVLRRLEQKHNVKISIAEIPDRVKELRRAIINELEKGLLPAANQYSLQSDLEDLFFVIQLYSYPGDYVVEKPVVERIAETLDKFEEDVLHAVYPAIRGHRRVVVQFGEPMRIPDGRQEKVSVPEFTDRLEQRVQSLLDEINTSHSAAVPQALVK